jgi:hypothetical protein
MGSNSLGPIKLAEHVANAFGHLTTRSDNLVKEPFHSKKPFLDVLARIQLVSCTAAFRVDEHRRGSGNLIAVVPGATAP